MAVWVSPVVQSSPVNRDTHPSHEGRYLKSTVPHYCLATFLSQEVFLPASCVLRVWPAGPTITLLFPRLYICRSVRLHLYMLNNYVTYIVAMRPYFSRLRQFRRLLCVAAKQRQRRRDDARLTESGNARSEQLSTRGAYRVANQQHLACLSGSEH